MGIIFGLLGVLAASVICGAAVAVETASAVGSALAASIQAGLVAGTVAGLVWYSIETRGMRNEMVRQNEMAVWPMLISAILESPGVDEASHRLVIRNVGKGPALFVKIDNVIAVPEGRFNVEFDSISVIPAGEEELARARVYIDGVLAMNRLDTFVAALNPRYGQDTHLITVRYQDLAGSTNRWTLMQMGKEGIRLINNG
jgi:hypothetical protein